MPRVNFHLNGDESVEGFYNTDTNEVMLVSSHENTRNDHQIVENLNRILSVRNTRGGADICLGNDPFVHINSKDGAVQYLNTLTSFETRLFSRKTSKYALPFDRSKKPVHLKTDLHTHFAAALTPSQLIDRYPEWLVKKLNLDTQGLTPTEKQGYLLDDLISNKKNYELLIDSMKIDTSEQETFNKMEDIYTARGPITKNPDTFLPMLNQIAKASANAGVTYLELSLSSIISDMRQLSLLEQNLPRIEKETGVTLRFLGALSRHSDKEWNDDEVEKLIISSRSPYIV